MERIGLKIDYISDLHIDSYISKEKSKEEFLKSFERIQSIIYPYGYNFGKVLIIPGDISHYNHQIVWVLEYYSKFYDYVLYTHGNHEMYSLQNESSFYDKLDNLKKEIDSLDKVYYMNGESISINGYKIGGIPMWYDFSYAKDKFNMSEEHIYILWVEYMSDATRIKDGKSAFLIETRKGISKIEFDTLMYFEEQYKLLEKLNDCNLIFSHIMPFIPDNYPDRFKVPATSFFVFNAKDFILKSKVKKWICGHTHTKVDARKYGIRLYANPYGYPNELIDKKIRYIEV